MELIYPTQKRQMVLRYEEPFFKALCDFLNRQEAPTLRQIKAEFPNEKIDKKLEAYLKDGVIERKDRRYTQKIPVVTNKQAKLIVNEWLQRFEKWYDGMTEEEIQLHLLQLPLQPVIQTLYLEEEVSYSHKQIVENHHLKVMSLSENRFDKTLPNYFFYQQYPEPKEAFDKELEQLLGDVDSEYYLDQVYLFLDKLLANRRRIRENIFIQSLILLKIVAQEEQGYHLLVPVQTEMPELTIEEQAFSQLPSLEQHLILGAYIHQRGWKTITAIQLKEIVSD